MEIGLELLYATLATGSIYLESNLDGLPCRVTARVQAFWLMLL